MDDKKSIVVTTYGHGKIIDKIAVSLFENHENSCTHCDTINSLELKGDAWIFAKILSENTYYGLDVFLPLKFSDIILKLDNRAIQKILKEIDPQELIKALKDQNEAVKEKIFTNMSKRAAAMLREDFEFIGPCRKKDIKEYQEKILSVIRYFDQCGEIVIPYKGETTE
jgi:flagellar motor switch protein FliG